MIMINIGFNFTFVNSKNIVLYSWNCFGFSLILIQRVGWFTVITLFHLPTSTDPLPFRLTPYTIQLPRLFLTVP